MDWKKICFAVLLTAFMFFSKPGAQAQETRYQLRINPGMVFPTGDFKNIAGKGPGADLGLSIYLKTNIALSIDLGYYAFDDKEKSEFKEPFKCLPLSLTGDFLFRNNKKFHPLAGIGMAYMSYRQTVHYDYADATETMGRVGLALKAGGLYSIDEQWSVGVHARYLYAVEYSLLGINAFVALSF